MKDLLEEGRKIQETFRRKLNEEEQVTPTNEAKRAAKYFVSIWENWFNDEDVSIDGEEQSGIISEIVEEYISTGTIIVNFHNAITDVLVDDETNVNACAEQIQYIVNNGKTDTGDFAGSVKVRQYLNSIPPFVIQMNDFIKNKVDGRESKKIFTNYKNSVQKFANMLRVVAKN